MQNGNTSDKRGNQEAIDELLATLTPERLRETVYVADAALLTTANLRIMDQARLREHNKSIRLVLTGTDGGRVAPGSCTPRPSQNRT